MDEVFYNKGTRFKHYYVDEKDSFVRAKIWSWNNFKNCFKGLGKICYVWFGWVACHLFTIIYDKDFDVLFHVIVIYSLLYLLNYFFWLISEHKRVEPIRKKALQDSEGDKK